MEANSSLFTPATCIIRATRVTSNKYALWLENSPDEHRGEGVWGGQMLDTLCGLWMRRTGRPQRRALLFLDTTRLPARSHLYAHKTGSILWPARGISSGDPMQRRLALGISSAKYRPLQKQPRRSDGDGVDDQHGLYGGFRTVGKRRRNGGSRDERDQQVKPSERISQWREKNRSSRAANYICRYESYIDKYSLIDWI